MRVTFRDHGLRYSCLASSMIHVSGQRYQLCFRSNIRSTTLFLRPFLVSRFHFRLCFLVTCRYGLCEVAGQTRMTLMTSTNFAAVFVILCKRLLAFDHTSVCFLSSTHANHQNFSRDSSERPLQRQERCDGEKDAHLAFSAFSTLGCHCLLHSTDFKPISRAQPNKYRIMRFSTASSFLTTIASAALRPCPAAASVSSAARDDAQASEHLTARQLTDGKCTFNILVLVAI